MSLVVLLANPDQIILVADRRISVNAVPLSEEYSKVGVLLSRGLPIRFAFGMAGLAAVGDLIVRQIVLRELAGAFRLPVEGSRRPVDEFSAGLTRAFCETPAISRLPLESRSLTVILAGFDYREQPPRLWRSMVSNFQDFITGIDGLPHQEFRIFNARERRPFEGPVSSVQRIGVWGSFPPEHAASVRALLEQRRPPRAIIGKGIDVIRTAADDPRSRGLIGKQISWVMIPGDPTRPATDGYSSYGLVRRVPLLTGVIDGWLIDGGVVEPAEGDAPMDVGWAPKNAPCPCGSQRKFRRCHGRNVQRRYGV